MTESIPFADLQPGRRFETAAHAMELQPIRSFAAAHDPQPAHLDAAAATATRFGALVGSGWHTAAVTARLEADALLLHVPGLLLDNAVHGLAWPRPVLPGDTIRAVIEVVEAAPHQATLHTTTLNQRDETVMEHRRIVRCAA